MKKLISLIAIVLFSANSFADIMQDFDSLGGNDVLLDKAQAIQPETRVQVVQDRIVDRRLRHEISPETGLVAGGFTYLDSNFVGLNYQFHITPRWSVGAKYSYYFNELSPEGEGLVNKYDELTAGQNTDTAYVPELDWPLQSYMAVANWYPVYGKMNLHDLGILHFDVYFLGGYGQVQLKSRNTDTWTAGGGLGMWFSQYLSGRVEVRYQNYLAETFEDSKSLDLTVVSFNLGVML